MQVIQQNNNDGKVRQFLCLLQGVISNPYYAVDDKFIRRGIGKMLAKRQVAFKIVGDASGSLFKKGNTVAGSLCMLPGRGFIIVLVFRSFYAMRDLVRRGSGFADLGAIIPYGSANAVVTGKNIPTQ